MAGLYPESETAPECCPERSKSAAPDLYADLDSVVSLRRVCRARTSNATPRMIMGRLKLDLFVQRAHVEIITVTEEHAEYARSAYRRFGRGRHAAGLNFGDCFAYALARALDEPLLFVGDDFGQTDVHAADY